MRQRAFESDLIVVNHALFFANLAIESDEIGRVLPDFSVLILDEAHEVEDTAADFFGKRLSNFQCEDLCRELAKILPDAAGLEKTCSRIETSARRLFQELPGRDGRFSLNFFRGAGGPPIDLRWELSEPFQSLLSSLQSSYHQLGALAERPQESDALMRRIHRYVDTLEEIFLSDNPENVYWFEKSGRGVYLLLTPIDIGPILKEKLFSRTDSTILTSATLTTEGTFDYIRQRLGLDESMELVVPGEFDFARQTMLYVPRTLPGPHSSDFLLHLVREVRRLLKVSDGGAFVLFTSVRQMLKLHAYLEEDSRYPLFLQGEMPKETLLEQFKQDRRSVLCATSSFWQGVDVRGQALRSVIIDKLPFQVPTEPLVSARIDRLRREGQDPFLRYTVPCAVLSLRQGLGRLIRSRKDHGILAILDSRLWAKSYGKLFFDSLPNCPVTDNIEQLTNFFGRNVSEEV
jgi:ATP-dependent DNA helicase DinG